MNSGSSGPSTTPESGPEPSVETGQQQPPLSLDAGVRPKSPKKAAKAKGKPGAKSPDYLISTSSPEGIAAAAQITPARIARILLAKGPLPIRRLTAQLVAEVPAFGHLSLSKQRRLIMAALEAGDTATLTVFDKIGWGQWEAEVVSREEFDRRAQQTANNNTETRESKPQRRRSSTSQHRRSASIQNTREPEAPDLLSSSAPVYGASLAAVGLAVRRDSITNPSNDLHTTRPPLSPSLRPLQSLRNSLRAGNVSLDEAIESSSDDDADLELGGAVFGFDEYPRPTLRSPLRSRSMSNSNNSASSRRPSFGGVAKPRKPRSSFSGHQGHHTIEAALDEGPLALGGHPSSVPRQSFLRTNISPRATPAVMMHEQISNLSIASSRSRRASALIRSTTPPERENLTDEEDWEAIGPSSLRNGQHSPRTLQQQQQSPGRAPVAPVAPAAPVAALLQPQQPQQPAQPAAPPSDTDKEMTAAIALMNLRR